MCKLPPSFPLTFSPHRIPIKFLFFTFPSLLLPSSIIIPFPLFTFSPLLLALSHPPLSPPLYMDFGGQDFSLVWLDEGFFTPQLPDLDFDSSFLYSEIQNQNVEMDHFLQLQSSRMRRAIMEEEARQRAITMQRFESRANALLLEKDEQIAAARDRTRELQRFLSAAESEAAAWEREAREREGLAAELSKQLMEAEREATTSFCSSSSTSAKKEMTLRNCKVCHAGQCGVVLFPCRHICCCRSCEPLLDHCPLCQTLKEATLQVLL